MPRDKPTEPADATGARRYDSAFEDSAIGMAIEDLDGRFLAVNATLCDMVGYSRSQLLAMNYREVCHPDDVESDEHLSGLAEGRIPRYIRELRYLRADGSQIWVRVHVGVVRDGEGAVAEYAVQIEDVTSRRQAEERLLHQAGHDALTGLPNRHSLARHLREAGPSSALLFVDLDRFKLVNDSLGHTVGDELLLAVAGRLRHAVPSGDVVARIGGDEFVVVAHFADDVTVARRLADRLQEALVAPFGIGGHLLHVTASVGVAIGAGLPPDDLLRSADLAMHAAKNRGRARTAVFHPGMVAEAEHRLGIEQGLHRAVADGGLSCWYQPVVCLVTGRTVAAEALLRWHHADGRLLVPDQFLAVAEETGLAAPIGRLALQTALGDLRTWRDHGIATRLHVNLSGRQLDAGDAVADILTGLDRRGLLATDLCVEVGETALLVPDGAAARAVAGLRRAGVAVAVDDFGRGHSSLAYLRSHPVDLVKIDRSFVTGLDRNPRDGAIVQAVVDLTHALGMTCVAEGVETREELRRLAAIGCDQVQGYLLGRPRPAGDFLSEQLVAGNGRHPGLDDWLGAAPT